MRSHAEASAKHGAWALASTSVSAQGRMEVQQRMRWRQSFMAEVAETLQHLGMKACPVCGSAESLSMGRFPTLLVDGSLPSDAGNLSPEERGGDLTFAVRVECATCGHLMLFDSRRYRTGDEKIMEATRDEERQLRE